MTTAAEIRARVRGACCDEFTGFAKPVEIDLHAERITERVLQTRARQEPAERVLTDALLDRLPTRER